MTTGPIAMAVSISSSMPEILPPRLHAACNRGRWRHRQRWSGRTGGVASVLLMFIVALVIVAWRQRKDSGPGMTLPLGALAVTLFLAVLGVLYGSPLLRPPVVMANLLGGMALLGMLWWLYLSQHPGSTADTSPGAERLRKWALLGLALVVAQTALGGWVSSNFSALACPTFPLCKGVLWPEMDIPAGFTLRHLLVVSPEGRVVVELAATLAVHMVHRLGAVLVLLFVAWLGYRALKLGGRTRSLGMVVFVLLGLQVLLGMAVVVFSAPLGVVVTHNATAALLWLTLLALIHRLPQSRRH
ncbi:MAG TPA: heme A synthase [Gammaproteobacteria bacterium]|nr:heme A synthase [Gammaproteobacteria bacterium]